MNTPLRLGILGAANIAHGFVSAVAQSQQVKITAVASRDLSKAQAFAQTHGLASAYGNYEALLADPNIDAIYNPLPNHLHAPWTIQALQAGKHVLCEKPLCLSRAEAVAMFAAAAAKQRILLEAYPYWFQPQTAEMMGLVGDQVIGEVRSVQASFGFSLAKPEGNIRFSADKGGGALLDAGSYPMSLIRLLMGEAPLRVMAHPVWSSANPLTRVDISLMATLEFSGGRQAQLSCAMNVANHRRATIMGSAGTIETEYINHPSAAVPSQLRLRRGVANSIPFEAIDSPCNSGFFYAAETFVQMITKQDQALMAHYQSMSIDIAHSLHCLAASARSGTWQTL
jgi:predicted dehydrogenase